MQFGYVNVRKRESMGKKFLVNTVLVWDNEKVLEMNSGDGYFTLCYHTHKVYMLL